MAELVFIARVVALCVFALTALLFIAGGRAVLGPSSRALERRARRRARRIAWANLGAAHGGRIIPRKEAARMREAWDNVAEAESVDEAARGTF